MKDASSIGQDAAIQNPEDMLDRTLGVYSDAADRLSPDQRFPNLPQGPDPAPFGSLSSPKVASR